MMAEIPAPGRRVMTQPPQVFEDLSELEQQIEIRRLAA
jgi:hypothetical protein